jgi:hypothetical protein
VAWELTVACVAAAGADMDLAASAG